jgi:hypothetical protein
MSTFATDNRWSAGASGATLPDTGDIVAAYGARWIDQNMCADIVPDRQGFAYDRDECRDLLIAVLVEEHPHSTIHGVPRDQPVRVVNRDDAEVWVRRSGGYVYVDAWLWSEEYEEAQREQDEAPGY